MSEQPDDRKFALFDTAIGICGIVWTPRGVEAVQLPLADKDKNRRRIRQRYGSLAEAVPPGAVQTAIDGMIALLEGKLVDLSGVALDLGGVCEFDRRVYDITRTILPGRTMTYGGIAKRLGGVAAKLKMLAIEGAIVNHTPGLFD